MGVGGGWEGEWGMGLDIIFSRKCFEYVPT